MFSAFMAWILPFKRKKSKEGEEKEMAAEVMSTFIQKLVSAQL